MNIEISKLTKDDIPKVHQIAEDSFPIPWSIKSIEDELNNLLCVFLVAKLDDEVIGFLCAWFVMDECHIGNICVKKEFRKQGVASLLLDELLKKCKEHETTYIMLEVRLSNIPAQELYKKYGFTEDVVRKNYYKNPDGTREDALIMSYEMFC